MTYVTPYMSPLPLAPRASTGLMVFGIISIVLGSLFALMALLLPLSMLMTSALPTTGTIRRPPMQLTGVVTALAMYIGLATALIMTGIGSCKARRWVRPVVLAIAWPSMVMGVVAIPAVASMMRGSLSAKSPGLPPQMVTTILFFTIAIMVIFYVLLPLSYILFYQRASVQANLALCDPYPRWTDGCPIPVLGLSFWLAITAMGLLTMIPYMCVPFFGTYITGPAAVAIIAVAIGLLAWSGWATYQLKIAGWWAATILLLGWPISAVMTFGRSGMMDFYHHSRMDPVQLEILERQPYLAGPGSMIMLVAVSVIAIVFLLFVRRYFAGVAPTSPISSDGG